jgi:1-deoxy-D-xylulose-5-phosphate reductoisomerase
MGRKVTIDSATLMNKGLEVIEAHWLFNVSPERIKVLIHPESIVHGMVQIIDGSLFAYLATPDMKIPIAFALNLGKRRKTPFERIDLAAIGNMNFYTPDTDRFPALRLAYNALEAGDSALITFNAANETASQAFFEGRIQFIDIARLVEEALDHHHVIREIEDQETIRDVHNWTKTYLSSRLRRINA